MAEEETRTLDSLAELSQVAEPVADDSAPEPKIDPQGRTYSTGKRKDAVARVWIKPGTGKVTINGRDQEQKLSSRCQFRDYYLLLRDKVTIR